MRMGKNMKAIYDLLWRLSNEGQNEVCIGQLQISSILGIHQVYVQKALNDLRDGNLIDWKSGKFGGNISTGVANKYTVRSKEMIYTYQEALENEKLNELEICIDYTEKASVLTDEMKKYLILWLKLITETKIPNLKLEQYKLKVNDLFKFCSYKRDGQIMYNNNEILSRIQESYKNTWASFVFKDEVKKQEVRNSDRASVEI